MLEYNKYQKNSYVEGNVSCSRKQRGPLMGLQPTTSTLRVRRATQCAVAINNIVFVVAWLKTRILALTYLLKCYSSRRSQFLPFFSDHSIPRQCNYLQATWSQWSENISSVFFAGLVYKVFTSPTIFSKSFISNSVCRYFNFSKVGVPFISIHSLAHFIYTFF